MLEEIKIPDAPKADTNVTYNVREYPDDMLKERAQLWVNDVTDQRFQELVDGLETTLRAHGALGLAGPQVGIPFRILTINRAGKPCTMVNPRITKLIGDQVDGNEGCLSFPGLYIKVKRVAGVEVTYTNRKGEAVTETLTGIEARAVQHEIDHLDGVVFIDRIPKVKRSDAMRKWRLAPRQMKQQNKRLQDLVKQFKARDRLPATVAPPAEVPGPAAAPVT